MLGRDVGAQRRQAISSQCLPCAALECLLPEIADRGWVGITYPKEYGGQGGDRISQYIMEEELYRVNITISLGGSGGKFTYEGSAEKVFAPERGVRTTEAFTQMLGQYGQLLNGSPGAIRQGLFAHNVLGAFQSGINHGSVQVMRDQVARRGLGLPRVQRRSS